MFEMCRRNSREEQVLRKKSGSGLQPGMWPRVSRQLGGTNERDGSKGIAGYRKQRRAERALSSRRTLLGKKMQSG